MDKKTEAVAKLVQAVHRFLEKDHAYVNYDPQAICQMPDRKCCCGACDEGREALDAYTASRLDSTMDRLHEELTNEQP